MSKRITPKMDIVFKKIFGSVGNEAILKDFLEYILDMKIKDLSLNQSTELLPDLFSGKNSRIDVRAELDDGTKVDIEMQTDKAGFSEERCLQYWSRLYTNDLEKGEQYHELKKTICIWIVDDEVYNEFKEFESTWKMREEKLGIRNHFNKIEIHVIELKKFRKTDIIKPSKKEFWLWFLDYTNERMVEMACLNDDMINEARAQLEKIKSDPDLYMEIVNRQMYDMDQKMIRSRMIEEGMKKGMEKGMKKGMKKGIEKGMEKGMEKGEKKKQLEIAKNMKEKDIDIATIAELTGLTEKEIEKL